MITGGQALDPPTPPPLQTVTQSTSRSAAWLKAWLTSVMNTDETVNNLLTLFISWANVSDAWPAFSANTVYILTQQTRDDEPMLF